MTCGFNPQVLFCCPKKEQTDEFIPIQPGDFTLSIIFDFEPDNSINQKFGGYRNEKLHEEDITTCRIARKNVSISSIEETEFCCFRSIAEEIEEAEEKDEFSEEVRKVFRNNFTVTQLRRLKMSALLNMSQRGIAIAEHVNQLKFIKSVSKKEINLTYNR